MKRAKTKKKISPAELALLHVHSLEVAKQRYKIADEALRQLRKRKKVGTAIALPDSKDVAEHLRGKKYCIVDKFADRDAIPVGMNARRFEMEPVTEV